MSLIFRILALFLAPLAAVYVGGFAAAVEGTLVHGGVLTEDGISFGSFVPRGFGWDALVINTGQMVVVLGVWLFCWTRLTSPAGVGLKALLTFKAFSLIIFTIIMAWSQQTLENYKLHHWSSHNEDLRLARNMNSQNIPHLKHNR